MARQLGAELGFGKRIKLIEKNDGGPGIAATLALCAKLVSDFSGTNQHSSDILDFTLRDHVQEAHFGKISEGGGRFRPPQHTFGRKHHQRLAPTAKRLADRKSVV